LWLSSWPGGIAVTQAPASVMPYTVVRGTPRRPQFSTSADGTGEPPTAATNGRSGASGKAGNCSMNW
jgi:hypothetical protein